MKQLTNWQLIAMAVIINIVITSIGVFLSNLSFLRLDNLVNRSDESAENARQFEQLQLSHERTTKAIQNSTKTIGIILLTLEKTQKDISQLTNDIYIMQKQELESRKTSGQFLAVVAANNNITIPEDLRKRLLISNAEPEQAAPNY